MDSKQYAQHQQVQKATGSKVYPKFLEGVSHRGFCILHLIFKVAAIISYVLLGLFVKGKSLVFIVVMIFTAFDFWVVKNLTGR